MNYVLCDSDGHGKSIEVMRMDKYEGYLIELHVNLHHPPIFVSIKGGRSYVPMDAVSYVNGTRYFEFYSKLFPVGKVPSYDVLFSNMERLFAVPVEELMKKGEHNIFSDRANIDSRIMVNAKWCEKYELYANQHYLV